MKVSVTSFWEEFKKFAFQGNMIDLAVAVVIGTAFKAVIDALVNDIIMPLISYVLAFIPGSAHYETWHIGRFKTGDLLSELIKFFLIALAVFIVIVKVIGMFTKKPPAPAEPTTKECPRCLSMIPFKATKCAHCTVDLPTT